MVNDRRQEIYTFIYNNFATGTNPILDTSNINGNSDLELLNSFNIIDFKNDFNNLLENFNESYEGQNRYLYDINKVFKEYILYPKFSNTLLDLMNRSADAVLKDFRRRASQDDNELIRLYTQFNEWFAKTYKNRRINEFTQYPDTIDPNNFPSDDDFNKIMINAGLKTNVFTFYNKIVSIEQMNPVNNTKKLLQELSLLINKYYFLTEILLKILLDTNLNETTNNFSYEQITSPIKRNFEYNNNSDNPNNSILDTNKELGLAIPWWWDCRRRSWNNRRPSWRIRDRMKNKLIKQIYNIIIELRNKLENIRQESSSYIINNNELDEMEVTIRELNKDKARFKHINSTLENKQTYININKNKQKRNLIILVIFALLIVIFNLYVFFSNPQNSSLAFQINVSIIVVIIIIKFYYLFK